MTEIGLQIGPRRVRAVVAAGWPRARVRTLELPFGDDRLSEAVDALRAVAGRVRRVAVAVDLQLLRIKRLALPAVPAGQRRRIVQLEPERFFAVHDEDLVAAIEGDDGLVFAAPTAAVDRWVSAIEQLAPVDVIEPAPQALARVLVARSITDATVLFDAEAAGIGMAEIREGRVTHARRPFVAAARAAAPLDVQAAPHLPISVAASSPTDGMIYLDPWTEDGQRRAAGIAAGGTVQPLPAPGREGHGEMPGSFATAYGALLALADPPPVAQTLLSAALERRVRGRRTRTLGLAMAACAAALAFALASLDDRQARTALDLERAATSLSARAAPALAMQAELASLQRRADAIRATEADRVDPLRVLRAVSGALPAGAFVRQIRATDNDWQVDGYAPNASAVLSALGTSPEFHDVHFLAATSRAQVADKSYESFALAFRFAGAP